jgi:hypothetical protein
MGDSKGSSSYGAGDTGGSHGDYVHGVSDEWIRKRVNSGVKKA